MSLWVRTLGVAACVLLAVFDGVADASTATSTVEGVSAPAVSLVGLNRDEVIALRGKPSGERARADGSVVLVYPDGAKVELRDGRVVSASGVGGAEIVGPDGIRHVPGADGNIQRTIQVTETAAKTEPPLPVSPPEEGPAVEEDDELPPGAVAPPSVEAARAHAAAQAAGVSEEVGDEGAPAASPVARVVNFVVEALLRFGLAVLVLRIAIQVVGVPFFWPDLLKVALLYLAVHEVMGGLAALGGLWEFISIFRLDSLAGFVVLACSLTWFKIAGSGLTALKIAVATGLVLHFLMLFVGAAIALVVPALLG